MAQRMAGAVALLAFAVCLIVGIAADNSLAGSLRNALYALACTLGVGLVVGWTAEKMLDEHMATQKKKNAEGEIPEAKQAGKDR